MRQVKQQELESSYWLTGIEVEKEDVDKKWKTKKEDMNEVGCLNTKVDIKKRSKEGGRSRFKDRKQGSETEINKKRNKDENRERD